MRRHLSFGARLLCTLSLFVLLPARAWAQTEAVEYYGLDALGSVRVVFDANGTIVGRMDYGPFGQEPFGGTNLPDRRFAGLFRDGEAGLDHAQARSYQSRTGRFGTVDPVYGGLFAPQRWNRYAYALNSPLVYVDPDGLQADPCHARAGEDLVRCRETVTVKPTGGSSSFGWNSPTFGSFPVMGLSEIRTSGQGGQGQNGFLGASRRRTFSLSDNDLPSISMAGVPAPGAAGAAVVAAAVAAGRLGEQVVKAVVDIGPKVAIRVNGALRVPDGLSWLNGTLSEVKNVASQGWTAQLKDYAMYAQAKNLTFNLYVRMTTTPSTELKAMAARGLVHIIPGLPW